MNLTIEHFNSNSQSISGTISRISDNEFKSSVLWPTGFMTDNRKIKLELAIEKYIKEKSEFREFDYLICWGMIRFNISKHHLDKFESYEIRSTKKLNIFAKHIGDFVNES